MNRNNNMKRGIARFSVLRVRARLRDKKEALALKDPYDKS